MRDPKLPYFELFNAFRENCFPLGIGEYQALLETLTGVHNYTPVAGIISRTELLELCKILWLKPDQVPHVFDDIFNEIYDKFYAVEAGTTNSGPNDILKDVVTTGNDSALKPTVTTHPEPEKKPEQSKVEQNGPTVKTTGVSSFRIELGGTVADAHDLRQEKTREKEKYFLFSENYFLLSQRELHQALASVPERKNTGNASKIDVSATIQDIALKGYFNGPVYQKEQAIVNTIIVLNDHKGSMVAFERFSQMVSDSVKELYQAVSAQKKQRIDLYFQNVIDEYIYLNSASTEYQLFQEFIDVYKNKRTVIMIISDAGAARGGNSDGRVRNTIRMLFQLKTITERIVWINPMPTHRWKGTSAERIANFVPMFTIDRTGVQAAANHLRGKQTDVLE